MPCVVEKNYQPEVMYYLFDELYYEFIPAFGEEIDETYCGRDADGEKHYILHNPETNWQERIRKALVELGFYKEVEGLRAA